MRSGVVIGGLFLAATGAADPARADVPVALDNGGFEAWTSMGQPEGWTWGVSRDAKAAIARDDAVLHSGKASARLTSQSPSRPHVYGGVSRQISGLTPRNRYRVRMWVRGQDVGACWFGGGPGWQTRFGIPAGTYDWRTVEGVFATGAGEFGWLLRINVDSVTGSLWVDDVTVERLGPNVEAGAMRWLGSDDLVDARIWPAPPVSAARVIDADPKDFSTVEPVLTFPTKTVKPTIENYRGPDDSSFSLQACYDAEALYLLVVVTDDKHVQSQTPEQMWRSDSIQIAFDPGHNRTALGYDENDVEFGVALAGEEVRLHAWQGGAKLTDFVVANAKRVGDRTIYELAVEWELFGSIRPKAGTPIGFNLLVNDDDGGGRRGYIQWTAGIGRCKDPSSFATIILNAPPLGGQAVALLRPQKTDLYDDDYLTGYLYLVMPKHPAAGETLSVKLRPQSGGDERIVLDCPVDARQGVAEVAYVCPPDRLSAGKHLLVPSLKLGQLRTWAVTITRSDEIGRVRDRLGATAKALPAVKRLLDQARAKKIPIDYPQLQLAVVERFIDYGRDDLAHHRIERAGRVADHIERFCDQARSSLSDALAGKRTLPAVPRFRTGKVDVDAWHFVADTEIPATGRRERRSVFFNGYGHFNRCRIDIPELQAFGANIIQIERGPNRTVMPDFSTDMRSFDEHIMGGLADGAKHDVMVCLLTSPHYFPAWAYAKWPKLGGVNGGFIRFAIDPPETRRVHQTHLQAVAERVKNAPALHSICLSNEPVYIDSRKDATTQRMWLAYLMERHKTIQQLNARYGTRYASFEQVKIPPPTVSAAPAVKPRPRGSRRRGRPTDVPSPEYRAKMAVLYDWVRFNNQRFANWHRWMGGIVHGIAPDIRVHAKIMPTVWSRHNVINGVDPEQFCRISGLNGCDCWQMIDRSKGGRYACNWLTESMFYDLLASMRTAPVINTEDHLIRDRDMLPVPAGHTYTVLWQGAIHRLGASMVWVWERTYDDKHDFAGSILHRPENVEAAGRAHLDLMRLSREVVAFQNAPRQIGLLFSIAAIVHDAEYLPALQRVYEALSFTGLPIRFVSEDQIAAGEWGDIKLLIVPRAVHTPAPVAQAIAKHARVASGGRVLFIGDDCLMRDEYGRPQRAAGPGRSRRRLAPSARWVIMSAALVTGNRNSLPVRLRDELVEHISRAGIGLPAVMIDRRNRPVVGVEWQSVTHEGRTLVNLINMTKEPIEFGVSVGRKKLSRARDLIGLRDVSLPTEARPLVPMLLELPK